jgi:hypothetical protein
MNGIFYTGVVENRGDPMRLGRCQVRIVGLHSENKTELPTDMLPWAYPMQPVTSAAMNGIGYSPVGPVEGTWVVIFFRDEECQQPIMIGTFGGIPQAKGIDSNYVNDGSDYLIKTDGGLTEAAQATPTDKSGTNTTAPVQEDAATATEQHLGPLSEEEFEKYKINMARLETTSEPGGVLEFSIKGVVGGQNYGVVNAEGNVGKYQLNGIALNSTGYVSNVLNANGESTAPSNYKLADDAVWLGKNGVNSVTLFLTTAEAQEQAMYDYTLFNYMALMRLGVIDSGTDHKTILGYLAASHPDGPNRALALKQGRDIQDGYGNTTTDLYKVGYSAIDGDQPKTLPQNVPPGVDNSTVPLGEKRPDGSISDGTKQDGGIVFGFSDPNKKYPLAQFMNEPDTNRLARNEQIEKTSVGLKDATRAQKIPVAVSGATWNQPESPYNTQYPFNHVYQSESGHLQEFDDTPENERVHLYHTKGTFIEMDANGTQVNKIVGDGYQIIDRNGYVYVKGALSLTVDGETNVLMRSNANIEVIGDAKVYVRNNVDMRVSGKMDLSVLEDLNIECQNLRINTRENGYINSDQNLYVTTMADMHHYSKASMFHTADGNISTYAKANLFLRSDFSTNMLSKSNLNLTSDGGVLSLFGNGNINVQTTAVLNMRGGAIAQRSAGRFDVISTGGTLTLTGGPTLAMQGAGGTPPPNNVTVAEPAEAATPQEATDLENPPERLTPVNAFFPHLTTPPRLISGGSQFESPDEGDPSKFNQARAEQGVETSKQSQPVDVALPAIKPPPAGTAISCEAFKSMTEFPLSTKLSANFYLGDFIPGGGSGYICVASSPHKLMDQAGLTKAQIVCNLKNLAENVLEKLITIVPKSEIIITSGYRQKGLVGVESPTSQHPLGMACDVVLKKTPRDRKKHFDLIQQIASAVPHDQLILEYEGAATVWIHMSFNASASKQRNMNFTMNNHRKVADGYQLLV